MSPFQVPFSSSPPPATPESKSQVSRGRPTFTDMADNPSTTPAGPPPQSGASFTPAGPPPSTIFGSSQFGSDVSKLKFTKPNPQPESRRFPIFQPPRTKNGTPGGMLGRNTSKVPSSSILSEGDSFDRSESQVPDYEDGEEDDGGYDESMQMGESAGNYGQAGSPAFKGFTAINHREGRLNLQSSLLETQSNPSRRSKIQQSTRTKRAQVTSHQLPRKGKPAMMSNIARDLANRTQPASLTEPDEMILRTEDIMVELHQQTSARDDDIIQGILAVRSLELMRLWNSCAPPEQNLGEGIGPGSGADSLQNAAYLSSLLLTLRHPPLLNPSASIEGRSMGSKALTAPARPMPIPKILVDWLNRYHISYNDLFDAVRSTRPNCTAHDQFWDISFGMLVRGQVSHVIRLLSEADFQHASSALDDGEDEPGYHGAQLQAVQSAVYRAREVLRGCPATKGDWHIDSSDWDLFRKRVSSELEHLAATGGIEDDEDDTSDLFQAEHFGLQKTGRLLPRSTKTTHHQLPWNIYQKLKVLYGILLGGADEIISQSQDWLEATAALTIWWDGTEDMNITTWSINVGRAQRPDGSEKTEDPYLARISAAFLCVTDPDYQDSFQINSLNPLEVGLASILQGNIEGVLCSLRTYSLVIASAVAEIASLGGWLEQSQPSNAPGLDQEDLIVLSYGIQSKGITKNDLLLRYVDQLFDRQEVVDGDDDDSREGWELAISVASRVDDRQLATETITKLLDKMHLDSQDRLDKLLSLCSSLGLQTEARKVSERFADHLSANTTLYGPALLCYARSHAPAKIRQLVDLLVSYSLVQSAAYPPSSELDDDLRILVENPKRPLSKLDQIDAEAAGMLQFYLAGYACLRRFYNLRDEEINARAEGRTANMKPLARKRAAAKALIAVINSASDCIYGGLYDAERESAVQVDGLLTLLGELTVFIGRQEKRTLTSPQIYDALAAIEDLQTVNQRVYEATEDCLNAAVRNYRGSAPPSPRTMLKKSVSSGTASSGFSFSLMGSEMLGSGTSGGGGKSVGSSGVLVKGGGGGRGVDSRIERGWDWRARFADGGDKRKGGDGGVVKGIEVLGVLRREIASELAFAELEG
jgi:Nup85 Nucleoporin